MKVDAKKSVIPYMLQKKLEPSVKIIWARWRQWRPLQSLQLLWSLHHTRHDQGGSPNNFGWLQPWLWPCSYLNSRNLQKNLTCSYKRTCSFGVGYCMFLKHIFILVIYRSLHWEVKVNHITFFVSPSNLVLYKEAYIENLW